MNWISRSFNIWNFFCSLSQVFGYLGVPKNYIKFTEKNRCWGLFCEFCEVFLRIPFYWTAARGCFCNFNVFRVRFLIFCSLFTKLRYLFKYFTKVNKFAIVGKLLSSGASPVDTRRRFNVDTTSSVYRVTL